VAKSSLRILIVDDFDPFRRFIRSILQKEPAVRSILEAADGEEAVELAQELQPDVILLDVGLPSLNGIESAARICNLAPKSKILFISQESSQDIVREALVTGANGYVVKTDVGAELLTGIRAVLRGETFVSSGLGKHDVIRAKE
jgi:DNA-binding NarL/FixJ family response regulator